MTVGVRNVGVISLTGYKTGPPKMKVTRLMLWHTLGMILAKYWSECHSLLDGMSLVDMEMPTA